MVQFAITFLLSICGVHVLLKLDLPFFDPAFHPTSRAQNMLILFPRTHTHTNKKCVLGIT